MLHIALEVTKYSAELQSVSAFVKDMYILYMLNILC